MNNQVEIEPRIERPVTRIIEITNPSKYKYWDPIEVVSVDSPFKKWDYVPEPKRLAALMLKFNIKPRPELLESLRVLTVQSRSVKNEI